MAQYVGLEPTSLSASCIQSSALTIRMYCMLFINNYFILFHKSFSDNGIEIIGYCNYSPVISVFINVMATFTSGQLITILHKQFFKISATDIKTCHIKLSP